MAVAGTLVGLTLAGVSASESADAAATACRLPTYGPGSSYHPTIRPNDFSPRVTNPWYPLVPGTTFVYSGVKDNVKAVDIYAVSRHTKKIDGVVTRMVNDRLLLNGRLAERTTDYYAQDKCGNVWYFGEDTAELSHGKVLNTDGSFHAGVDGAQPGVYMQANPQLCRWFRQEWLKGEAEDQYRAVSKTAKATAPDGRFAHVLRTEETSALEPGVLDNKYYVKGIGEIIETTVKGPVETLKLVDVLT
jgi:hypothetical protein